MSKFFLTLIGLFLFCIAFLGAAASSQANFLHLWSLVYILCSVIGSFCLIYSWNDLQKVLSMIHSRIFYKKYNSFEAIEEIFKLSLLCANQPLHTIEGDVEKIPDFFLKKSLLLALSEQDPDRIARILDKEMSGFYSAHMLMQRICNYGAMIAPSLGMVGTLFGLIGMLENISDLQSLGQNLSLALITTLYGALAANFLFLPLGHHFKNQYEQEKDVRAVIVEGVLLLHQGENSIKLREQLKSFLSYREKANLANSIQYRKFIQERIAPKLKQEPPESSKD